MDISNNIHQTSEMIANPLLKLWMDFLNAAPNLITAFVILIVGYIISYLIGKLIYIAIRKTDLDRSLARARLSRALGNIQISSLIGEITKWYIFIIFLNTAVDIVQLGPLSELLKIFIQWLPNLIASVLIIIAGILIANIISHKIKEHFSAKGIIFAANIIKYVLTFMAILIAIDQIGIDISLIKYTFLILLAAFAFGLAIAFGIGMGAGMKSDSKSFWNKIKKNFK